MTAQLSPTKVIRAKGGGSPRSEPTKCIKIVYNTLPHSSIIRLWRTTGESSQPHHHQIDRSRPHKIFEIKKVIRFPTYPPSFLHHPFVRRFGESSQHNHLRDRQIRPSQNIRNKNN
ncbi:hypothetical protein TNCV_4921081 [Trichonephila clavipes]|uniref:Uncharacterized protein n=1 Tax=Trichonephila clavipes TaxID=2585209 RepID=A0A8X6RID9_TRICX|nr:hypothetical protein TNCV_4921081 [Trichonephila clavipes]